MKRYIFYILLIGITLFGIGIFFYMETKNNISEDNISNSSDSYISCGCGCCPSNKSLENIAKLKCIYKSKGESLEDKIYKDQQLSSDQCSTVGCSFPVKYSYCD